MEQLHDLYESLGNYDERPVDIEQFLDDPEFLGDYYQGKLYPYWRGKLQEIYPSPFYSPYWMVALRGSIGKGKTTIATTGVAYDAHKLLCMTVPQKVADLVPTTRILFAIFNVTMTLASDVVWGNLQQMFMASPWFRRMLGKFGTRRKRGEALFPKNVDFFMGSRVGHTLGRAIIEFILDEANFEIVGGQVIETFNSIMARMESRFMAYGGGIPGKAWIVSSESDKGANVNKIVDSYRGKAGVYVDQSALWDVKPDAYSGRKFWVFIGNDTRQPEIIEEDNPTIEADPGFCMRVPIEHKDRFEADIHDSLRSLAGVPTGTAYKLFRLRDRLNKALTVKSLFPEIVRIDFDDDMDQLWNYIVAPNYFKDPINKHIPRYISIDIGLAGDRLGLAGSYVSSFVQRKSFSLTDLKEVVEDVPNVTTEWAVAIENKSGQQVPLFKVRMFIQWLSRLGYPIALVAADGFQSADMLQLLTKMSFDTQLLSMDKTSMPYICWRNMVYEGRWLGPRSELLRKESEELEVTPDGGKVDHPDKNRDGSKGSKDIADAAGSSAYLAELNCHKYKLIHSLTRDVAKRQETEQLRKTFWPGSNT